VLFKPRKLVYTSKLYCKPIPVFILPRFNVVVVVIIVVDFLGLRVAFRVIS
jgi:hypothetical protein